MTLSEVFAEMDALVEKVESDFEREDLLIFVGYMFGTASRLVDEYS